MIACRNLVRKANLELQGGQQLVKRQPARLEITVIPQPVGDGIGSFAYSRWDQNNCGLVQLLKLAQQRQGRSRLAAPVCPTIKRWQLNIALVNLSIADWSVIVEKCSAPCMKSLLLIYLAILNSTPRRAHSSIEKTAPEGWTSQASGAILLIVI